MTTDQMQAVIRMIQGGHSNDDAIAASAGVEREQVERLRKSTKVNPGARRK